MKKFRIALTKLRVSSQRLEIEMDRWERPERIELMIENVSYVTS